MTMINSKTADTIFEKRIYRTVLSGSFRTDFRRSLRQAYDELLTNGCQILSPLQIDLDEKVFARGAAENKLGDKEIEKHHLAAIAAADFLWICAPDGYIGLSTSFEIGFAFAKNVPVFSSDQLNDANLANFVTKTTSVYQALATLNSCSK